MSVAQRVVGVCGLIGSGKSVVMRYFAHLGYPVYDCDAVAKTMYHIPEVREQITGLIGVDPIDPHGGLRKIELSKALSSSLEVKSRLEEIIHKTLLEFFHVA